MRRFLFAFLFASTSIYGSAILVTDATSYNTSKDYVDWIAQLGPAGTSVHQTFFAGTSQYETVVGHLTNGTGATVVAGSSAWKYTAQAGAPGVQMKDDLLATNGSAPLELNFTDGALYGAGAYVQANGGGQFTARIQAYAGLNSVLDMTVTSDAAGDAVFLGAADALMEITKVIYSLTSAPKGSTGDFVVDTLYLEKQVIQIHQTDVSGAPEPGTASLLALALAALGFTFKKRTSRV